MKKLIKTLAALAVVLTAIHFSTVLYFSQQEEDNKELIERLNKRHQAYFDSLSNDEKIENLKFNY